MKCRGCEASAVLLRMGVFWDVTTCHWVCPFVFRRNIMPLKSWVKSALENKRISIILKSRNTNPVSQSHIHDMYPHINPYAANVDNMASSYQC
jgi:hypothetical protein